MTDGRWSERKSEILAGAVKDLFEAANFADEVGAKEWAERLTEAAIVADNIYAELEELEIE